MVRAIAGPVCSHAGADFRAEARLLRRFESDPERPRAGRHHYSGLFRNQRRRTLRLSFWGCGHSRLERLEEGPGAVRLLRRDLRHAFGQRHSNHFLYCARKSRLLGKCCAIPHLRRLGLLLRCLSRLPFHDVQLDAGQERHPSATAANQLVLPITGHCVNGAIFPPGYGKSGKHPNAAFSY